MHAHVPHGRLRVIVLRERVGADHWKDCPSSVVSCPLFLSAARAICLDEATAHAVPNCRVVNLSPRPRAATTRTPSVGTTCGSQVAQPDSFASIIRRTSAGRNRQ